MRDIAGEARAPLPTLGLGGDLDEADMIRDVERAFGVDFADAPAGWLTIGDMEDALLARFATRTEPRACATAMAFRDLRAALDAHDAGPRTTLGRLRTGVAAGRTALSRRGLAMPPTVKGPRGILGLVLLVLGVPAAIALAVAAAGRWWLAPLCLVAGAAFVATDPGHLGGATLGDLSRDVAALNYGTFADRGADRRLEAVRRVLYDLACRPTGADPTRVTRATRLF